jgi:hypothetical protein
MSENGGRQKGDRGSAAPANGRRDSQEGDGGILAALPRTRPQRSSPRRTASARAQGSSARAQGSTTRSTKPARGTRKPTGTKREPAEATRKLAATPGEPAGATRAAGERTASAKKTPPRRREPPAPKQGYESLEEPRLGATVHPPSGAELVESIATIFTELASAGLKAGGRVLKDALSPLRRQ